MTSSNIGNLMDQNANGDHWRNDPQRAGTDDVYSIPMPASCSTPFVAPFNQTTLPLIVSGPHVVSLRRLDTSGDIIPRPTARTWR